MNILGIETSCDETSASIVQDGRKILSNIVASSLKEHQRYGGVIPEIASRRQIEFINIVVQSALEKAHLSLKKVNAIAVTKEPGLIGSLLVGISYARALSYAIQKPLIEVDHIKAHLYANFLKSSEATIPHKPPQLPAVGLVVSGGHTSLFHLKTFLDIRLIGQTRDDAAGEAFDKVARILGLGYPGGPIIDKIAKQGKNHEIIFSCAQLPNSNDFSFSGVKTAVLYYQRKFSNRKNIPVEKIAYSFQESVVSTLVKKSISCCKKLHINTLLVGGGVAANSSLRERLSKEASALKIKVYFPPLRLCLDNAAMIAGLGYQLYRSRPKITTAQNISSNL